MAQNYSEVNTATFSFFDFNLYFFGFLDISDFNLYEAPELLSDPVVQRDKSGMVGIYTETPHPVITYTLDGSKPTKDSKRFVETFPLPEGGEDWVSVGEIEYEIGNIVV